MLLHNIGRLFTGDGDVIEAAAVAFSGEFITWAGAEDDAPDSEERIDAEGALVTPGLVDAHTHPVYAGDRFDEIALRSEGATYEDIAGRGGGIGATVAKTRAAPPGALRQTVEERLRRWIESGTTLMEAKTGYHLAADQEVEAVSLLHELADDPRLPRLAITYLGAHALPPEFADRRAEFLEAIAAACEAARASGARFCDVFCDEGYFTIDESRRVLLEGVRRGLVPRLHADELARTGGALLAAELHAASADHLLQITEDDARALAEAGVVATLAPVTALAMGRKPPVSALKEAGAQIALGTDHNPGTSGLTDMTVAVALAVSVLGMSVVEALVAATSGGAASLRESKAGLVRTGGFADLVVWDAEHEGAFAWSYGVRPKLVLKGGAEVFSR
jgi:imidazolonepropionase